MALDMSPSPATGEPSTSTAPPGFTGTPRIQGSHIRKGARTICSTPSLEGRPVGRHGAGPLLPVPVDGRGIAPVRGFLARHSRGAPSTLHSRPAYPAFDRSQRRPVPTHPGRQTGRCSHAPATEPLLPPGDRTPHRPKRRRRPANRPNPGSLERRAATSDSRAPPARSEGLGHTLCRGNRHRSGRPESTPGSAQPRLHPVAGPTHHGRPLRTAKDRPVLSVRNPRAADSTTSPWPTNPFELFTDYSLRINYEARPPRPSLSN